MSLFPGFHPNRWLWATPSGITPTMTFLDMFAGPPNTCAAPFVTPFPCTGHACMHSTARADGPFRGTHSAPCGTSPGPTSLPYRIPAQQKEFQALKKGLGGARVPKVLSRFRPRLPHELTRPAGLRAALNLAWAVR